MSPARYRGAARENKRREDRAWRHEAAIDAVRSDDLDALKADPAAHYAATPRPPGAP